MLAWKGVSDVARGRLAYMSEPGVLEMREYQLPELTDGSLLVEVVAAGICGSDLHMFTGNHPLRAIAMGHEFVGRATDVSERPLDSAGEPLSDGDLLTATYFETCLHCPECSRGALNLCRNAYQKWLRDTAEPPHFCGTLATHYVISPRQWLYRIPDGVPPLIAASANCALAQVICGVERAALQPGEHVVIQGAGGLGLYATAVARERGARVIVIDGVAGRLEAARGFGADQVVSMVDHPSVEERREIVLGLTGGLGADVAFDFAGVPAALDEGVRLLRAGGRYMEIGNVLPGIQVQVDLGYLTRHEIAVRTVIRYMPRHLREALAFLARNVDRLALDSVIDGRYTLDAVEGAIDDAVQRRVNRAAVVSA